jgi:hypothetical protein
MVATRRITRAQTNLLFPITRRSGLKRSTSENTTKPSSIKTRGSKINRRLADRWIPVSDTRNPNVLTIENDIMIENETG